MYTYIYIYLSIHICIILLDVRQPLAGHAAAFVEDGQERHARPLGLMFDLLLFVNLKI